MAQASLRHRRRRAALLSAGALSVGAFLAYRYYQSVPKAENERELTYLQRLQLALKRYSDAFLLGGDLVSSLLKDLHTFVQSDSSELPQSIRQLARLLQSREVAQCTSALTAAVFRGIVDPQQNNPERTEQASDRLQQGAARFTSQSGHQFPGLGGFLTSTVLPTVANTQAHEQEASGRLQDTVVEAVSQPDAAERLLNALTSDRGKDLVSLVVNVAVRTSTREVCRCYERICQRQSQSNGSSTSSSNNPMDKMLSFAASARGEKLATACISAMASQAMTVYMEKCEGIDTWDDLLRTMCKEQHKEFIQQMVRTSIREGVYAAFGRQPPHMHQYHPAGVHVAHADSPTTSSAPSPRTPDNAAAQDRALARPSSSGSSEQGHGWDAGLTAGNVELLAAPNTSPPSVSAADGPAELTASSSTPGYLAGQFLQVASKPDGRSVLMMLTGTAAYEGAHGAFHSLDELCHGGMSHLRAAVGLALTMLLCCYLHRANPLLCG